MAKSEFLHFNGNLYPSDMRVVFVDIQEENKTTEEGLLYNRKITLNVYDHSVYTSQNVWCELVEYSDGDFEVSCYICQTNAHSVVHSCPHCKAIEYSLLNNSIEGYTSLVPNLKQLLKEQKLKSDQESDRIRKEFSDKMKQLEADKQFLKSAIKCYIKSGISDDDFMRSKIIIRKIEELDRF